MWRETTYMSSPPTQKPAWAALGGVLLLVGVEVARVMGGGQAVAGSATAKVASIEQKMAETWGERTCPDPLMESIELDGVISWTRHCPASGEWVELICGLGGCRVRTQADPPRPIVPVTPSYPTEAGE